MSELFEAFAEKSDFLIFILKISRYDYDKRNWKQIFSTEEEREMAQKALQLNGVSVSSPTKPTIRIKRIDFDGRLRDDSTLQIQLKK
jgi:hypothetical protein